MTLNRAEAKTLLPVIAAFAEGKTIQYRSTGIPSQWTDFDCEVAAFGGRNVEWRVKPEPRENWFKLITLRDCDGFTRTVYEEHPPGTPGAALWREVL